MEGLVSDKRWGCVTRRLRAKTVPADCEARWTLEMFKWARSAGTTSRKKARRRDNGMLGVPPKPGLRDDVSRR